MVEDVQGERDEPAGRRSTSGARRRWLIAAPVAGAVVVAIGVPVALAGRDRPDSPAAAAAPTPSFVEGQAPSLPPWQQHPDISPVPRSVAGLKGMPNRDGCPVDRRLLLAALRDSALFERLAAPREVTDVDCSDSYAAARTGRATVIFRYSATTGSWLVVGGGTSAACEDVPEAVRAHLLPCH